MFPATCSYLTAAAIILCAGVLPICCNPMNKHRVKRRPPPDDIYEICNLPKNFSQDPYYFVDDYLYCCRCPDDQIVLQNCKKNEPNTTVCGYGSATESTDVTTSVTTPTKAADTSELPSGQINENPPTRVHSDCSCAAWQVLFGISVMILLIVLISLWVAARLGYLYFAANKTYSRGKTTKTSNEQHVSFSDQESNRTSARRRRKGKANKRFKTL